MAVLFQPKKGDAESDFVKKMKTEEEKQDVILVVNEIKQYINDHKNEFSGSEQEHLNTMNELIGS